MSLLLVCTWRLRVIALILSSSSCLANLWVSPSFIFSPYHCSCPPKYLHYSPALMNQSSDWSISMCFILLHPGHCLLNSKWLHSASANPSHRNTGPCHTLKSFISKCLTKSPHPPKNTITFLVAHSSPSIMKMLWSQG